MDKLHELCAQAVESVVIPLATSGLLVAFLSLISAVGRLLIYVAFGNWRLSGCSWISQKPLFCHQQDFIGWFLNLDLSLSLGIIGMLILSFALAILVTVSIVDFFLTILAKN